jgi:hypothetical protein
VTVRELVNGGSAGSHDGSQASERTCQTEAGIEREDTGRRRTGSAGDLRLLPGQDEPLTDGWIAEQLDHAVDAVIDSGDCGTEPTVSARADRARRNQARNYGRPSARPQLAQKQPMCAHIHGHITTSARTESARRNGAGQMAFTVCNGCGVWSGCSPSVMWRERLASGRAGCSPLIEVLCAAEAATMPG